jgi:hypothetical protein
MIELIRLEVRPVSAKADNEMEKLDAAAESGKHRSQAVE